MFYVFLLFVVVSACEIGVLILSSDIIGIWPTVGLIILTGIVGSTYAKKQGAEVLHLAQIQMSRGELPSEAILDGICILAAGVFLITPGFITDASGLLLLMPITRGIIKIWLQKGIQKLIKRQHFHFMR